jgi:nicotinamidase-related amidase
MSDELADLLEFALSGRPEKLMDLAVAQLPPGVQGAMAAVTETVTQLAAGLPPAAPSPALRERVVSTARARLAARPRKAVIVCDMINDHLTRGCPMEVPRARAIVPALVERLDVARTEGVPVIHVLDRHEADDPELDEWCVHAVAGSHGAEVWPPLAPKPGDRIVTKATYSGFTGSDLQRVLDDLAVDTLVLTGCASEVQLLATATDAFQRGFAVELPHGAHAGGSEAGEQFVEGILAALAPYAPARRARLAKIASARL